jgi:predicted phage-related endonuclease
MIHGDAFFRNQPRLTTPIWLCPQARAELYPKERALLCIGLELRNQHILLTLSAKPYKHFMLIQGPNPQWVSINVGLMNEKGVTMSRLPENHSADRRRFIGGSDARIIMGSDEVALLQLWREKRGEAGPEDLSRNLIVQLGNATEDLNRRWYEANTGRVITDIQRRVFHPALRWMAATLDGRVEGSDAVFEAKFMLPWSFSEEGAAVKYMPQLQHNMWVVAAKTAVLSVITGGGKWVEITVGADPLYQHLIVTAERKFWRCVENGEPPQLSGVEPPKPRIEAVHIVDMSASNAWAEFSGIFARTRQSHIEHEQAKAELKALMPEDAKEAIGHGIRARRSKAGAISFDLLSHAENSHAPVQ